MSASDVTPESASGPTTAWLSLGANVGPRLARLRSAVRALEGAHHGPGAPRVSPVFETAPWGVVDQPRFLNLAVALDTRLSPHALLDFTRALEDAAGRQRTVAWGPRTLDVDVVLFGDRVIRTERLEVPHPRYASRRFVLEPLAALAPDARDPRTGETVAALAERLARRDDDEDAVVRVGALFDPALDRLDGEKVNTLG